ncbi:hypothetical protein [Streptomyces inhibens]|uniref:hypothetical protein n=1 Tax=Streptomyces inhibens TaxID=2293571 RepID=UPI001EE74F06|nr:hypothetical protein [Streptomyces inhibens]UKY54827.1 hypothetical protein KI385_42665 [Streptomyces inhibens]
MSGRSHLVEVELDSGEVVLAYRLTVARLLAQESVTDYWLMPTAAVHLLETDDDPR